MFQLQKPREPIWRQYQPGIRIQLRFGPTEARLAGQRHVREVLKVDETADPTFAFVVGCILWGAIAWEGLGAPLVEGADPDAPVEIAELNPDNLTALLRQRPDIYEDLDVVFVGEVVEAMSEKNASAPSPNGTSAAAPATAPDATGPADQSANTKPSAPSPKPAGGSGG